jgi:hypothetical protein
MREALPPLPQYAFMAWCSVKIVGGTEERIRKRTGKSREEKLRKEKNGPPKTEKEKRMRGRRRGVPFYKMFIL